MADEKDDKLKQIQQQNANKEKNAFQDAEEKKEQKSEQKGSVEVKPAEPTKKEDAVSATSLADPQRVETDDVKALSGELEEIMKKYNYRESDIPLTDPYWAMRNRLRALQKDDPKTKMAGKL